MNNPRAGSRRVWRLLALFAAFFAVGGPTGLAVAGALSFVRSVRSRSPSVLSISVGLVVAVPILMLLHGLPTTATVGPGGVASNTLANVTAFAFCGFLVFGIVEETWRPADPKHLASHRTAVSFGPELRSLGLLLIACGVALVIFAVLGR